MTGDLQRRQLRPDRQEAGRFVAKYHFTAELMEEVQRAYSGKRTELMARLDVLERKTGWPRWAFKKAAWRLGWATYRRRPWTEDEVLYLNIASKTGSIETIARKLHRSPESVKLKARSLYLSRQAREGYTLGDLQLVFGVTHGKVARWVERGLLGKAHRSGHAVRLTEKNVVRFIRKHALEYDLRRVDQDWFKGMVFGELAEYGASV